MPNSQVKSNSGLCFWGSIHKEARLKGKSFSTFFSLPCLQKAWHWDNQQEGVNVCIYIHWRLQEIKQEHSGEQTLKAMRWCWLFAQCAWGSNPKLVRKETKSSQLQVAAVSWLIKITELNFLTCIALFGEMLHCREKQPRERLQGRKRKKNGTGIKQFQTVLTNCNGKHMTERHRDV